jgi:hypothetical protein
MYKEGQTATHKDGRKIIFQNGQWRLHQGDGATPRPARQLATREQMQLDEMRAAARTSDEAARTAEQFVGLNKEQGTGGLWSVPGIPMAVSAFDPEVAQMRALTARMAPQQRVPGSGTTSDRDLSLYLQAVPGMDRPGKANAAIAQQARADADRRGAYAQFLDEYASQHGTLVGAEKAWAQSGGPQGGKQGRQRGWTNNLPEAQRKALPQFRGSKAPVGDKGNPFVPSNMAEFNRIPAGKWFLDDDGKVYQKGRR